MSMLPKLYRAPQLPLPQTIPPVFLNHHPPRHNLRMLRRLLNGQHRLYTSIHLRKNLPPLGKRLPGNLLFNRRFQLLLMLRILAQGKALHFADAQRVAQPCRELRFQATNRQPAAIAGLVVVVESAAIKHATFGFLLHTASQCRSAGHGIESKGGVSHADVHKLALPGLLALDYGGEDAHDGVVGASGYVGNLDTHGRWAAVGAATVAGNAEDGQVVNVVAGAVFVGAGLAIAGDGAVDQLRVDGFQGFITHAQAVHYTGAKLLHHNVVVLHQLLDLLHAFRLFKIELQGLLATAQVRKRGAELAIKGRHYLG